MAFFGLNPQESAAGDENAAMHQYDPMRDSAPGFIDGAGYATLQGIGTFYESASLLASKALPDGPVADRLRQRSFDAIQAMKPDPETTGWLGQMMYGLGSTVPALAFGGVPGAIVIGATQGNNQREEMLSKGVDETTANQAAAITGLANTLGGLIPVSLPGNIFVRSLSGAAINTAVNQGSQQAVGQVLKEKGYTDMARQYQEFDTAAVVTDLIMGAAFGAMGPRVSARQVDDAFTGGSPRTSAQSEALAALDPNQRDNIPAPPEGPGAPPTPSAPGPLQSDIDMAMAANNVRQLEIDSAPGIPTDTASRNSHIQAMNVATDQLLRGEDVNVGEVLQATEMLPKRPVVSHETRAETLADLHNETGVGEMPERQADQALPGSAALEVEGNPSLSSETGTPPMISPTEAAADGTQAPSSNATVRAPDAVFSTAKIPPATLAGGMEKLGVKAKTSSGSTFTVYQKANSVKKIVEQAKQKLEPLKGWLASQTEGIPGTRFVGARLKEVPTIETKIKAGREPRMVSDYLGSRFEGDSIESIRALSDRLQAEAKAIDVDDFLNEGKPGGYRAIHLQLVDKDGFSYEVQIVPKELLDVYEKAREPYAKWKDKRGNLTEEEAIEQKMDYARGQALFETAWQKFLNKEKGKTSASDRVGAFMDAARKNQEGAAEGAAGKPAEEPEVVRAQQIAVDNPDLQVTLDDGRTVSAAEALKIADADIEQAKLDSQLFEVAANCYLRNG